MLVGRQTPPSVDPEAAREAARDILSGAEYAEPQPSVVERAVEWLFDRIGSFFGTLTGGGPGSVVGWIVVVVLLAAAATVLTRALRVPSYRRDHGPATHVRYERETRWGAGEWRREADRLEAAGDRRGALRCRYQAMLAALVADGVVDEAPGRTAAEYGRLLGERLPDRRDAIDEVTTRFEAAWYGGEPVTPATLEAFSLASAGIVDDARLVGA